MARFFRSIPAGRIAFAGLFEAHHDNILTPGYDDLKKPKPVGLAGIRHIFTPNKYGETSPELTTISHMTFSCTFVGIIFGSYLHGKKAFVDFMENNQASQFANPYDANRKIQDTVLLSMAKGALKWGTKIGVFGFLFITSSTMFAAYIGHHGFVEYMVAGAITGSLLRFNMGIKGMIAGCIVGTVLGTAAGIMSSIILYLTGSSMESIQNSQYELKMIRNEKIRQNTLTTVEEGYENLVKSGISKDKSLDDIDTREDKSSAAK